jgi:hypothetical protein
MTRALLASLGCFVVLAACQPKSDSSSIDPDPAGRGGAVSAGGRAGSGSGGASASGGAGSGSGGTLGSGGANSGGSSSPGTGGSDAAGGAGGSGVGGSGAASGGAGGGSVDAPVAKDTPSASDSAGGAGDAFGAEGDHLPDRPDLKICRKEWTPAQCCEFLCSCLTNICSDSAKGKPGLATCMSWCPKLGDMARRCHVYHCFVSISPTGGLKDHDSHCGHAADQVAGGGCPDEAWK